MAGNVPLASGTEYFCFFNIAENEVNEKCEPESNDPRKAPDVDDVMNMLHDANTSMWAMKKIGESKLCVSFPNGILFGFQSLSWEVREIRDRVA